MENRILDMQQVTKKYGSEVILGPISLSVSEGEIIGIRGQNGAGKTTLLKLCAGLLKPDNGRILYGEGVQKAIGYVPQDIALYPSLSGYDNLDYWAELQGLKGRQKKERILLLLEQMNLTDKARNRVETYSGGMKRRLNLAAALLKTPKLLLLDEATVGADEESTERILQCVQEAASVLMVTHRPEEWKICSRVITLEKGHESISGKC